ncbi:MAG TPA: AMP-binding protein, partial [Ilumatobacteraceae bacterium]|nr:AMP-binding protein [Ilumatobacteraceae bacterium]
MSHQDVSPPVTTMWGFVAQRADRFPERTLLADHHGQRLNGREFRDRAEAVAAGLYGQGIEPGSVVSWLLPTTIDTLVLMAALARLGAVQQPIIPMLSEREVAHLTGISNPALLISVDELRGTPFGGRARSLAAGRGFQVLIHDQDHPLPTGDPAV